MPKLTNVDLIRIAIERVGAIAGAVEPKSCVWVAAMDVIEDLETVVADLEGSEADVN